MLEISNINSFYGKAHVLRDLSFEVPKGEVVALLGRTGAGKSTTMKSVMQMVRTASGSVIFRGRDISNLARTLSQKWVSAMSPRIDGCSPTLP